MEEERNVLASERVWMELGEERLAKRARAMGMTNDKTMYETASSFDSMKSYPT